MIQETCKICGSLLLIEDLKLNEPDYIGHISGYPVKMKGHAVEAKMKCPNWNIWNRGHSRYTVYSDNARIFYELGTYGREVWEMLNFDFRKRERSCSPKYMSLSKRNFKNEVPQILYRNGEKDWDIPEDDKRR